MIIKMIILFLGLNMMNELVIFNFDDEKSGDWQIVNDGVMGGLSRSSFELIEGGYALFSGNVRPENNGGFASVRTPINDMDLSNYEGAMLKIKGDGNVYNLRFRTNRNFDGVSYQAKFESKNNEWSEVKIPFSEFIPTFRGRKVPNQPPLDPADILQMGILIADKQFGNFEIILDWIKFYKE
jgi:monofunctional biosynthetic peptidoglycan transglycosylase